MRNKAETEWFEGVWLGPATGISETLTGTKKGVIRASSIKRHDPLQRWSREALTVMHGALQQPDPRKPGLHITARIRLYPPIGIEADAMRPARDEDMLEGAYIKKHHFEKYGYTDHCEACRRLSSGILPRRPHSDICRKRMYEELGRQKREGGGWKQMPR